MDSEPKIFRPSGTHVQLTGIILVALVAVGWAFITQDTPLQPDGRPVPPRMLIQWSYFLASLVLLVSSLYAGCFTFINEQKHRCHPKCHLLFIGLTLPGFSSIFNASDSQSDDVLMLALSVQLVCVALMYCVIASEHTQFHPTSNKRITIGTLVGRFMQLDLGLQIFLLFSLFLSSFSLFPYAWRAFMPSGFWEARIVGLDGVISLGNAMAALLGYQLLDYLPPRAGIAHIVCYSLCALGSILPATPFRFLILTLPILVQMSGIFWDILEVHGKQASELQEQSDDCKYWQSMAEQLQVINNLRESAITTKSSFLAGLANEMKSIVHGTSMIMSMLNDTDIQPNQGTYLARLDRAVDRLTNLVREAQYYFEVESQKSTTDSVPFRLDQLLEEVINSTPIRSHLEERDVDVTYLVEPKVPMCLLGDYFRLKNILLRLLTNAIKATVQGEIIIWVRLNSPTPNVPTSPSSISSTTQSTPPSSPQSVRQVLRVSSDPATKVSDLKISKLVPHEALTTAYSTSHSAPTTPMSSHRDMSPRSSSALATSQSFSSASPRNRRNPYNINVNTNLDSNSHENLSSPKSQYTPRNPINNNNHNNSHNNNHSIQRSSSLNSLRTPTPKSATGYRVPPDFESESHAREHAPPSPSPLSPPTPPPTILHDGKDLFSSLGDDIVQLSISVVDTGIGIPPEDLSRIFEPFAMVNRKREDTDLGLGLSICKQLSRLFGGNLTVQSELSRGTSFTLTCPFKINSNTQLQNINNMFGAGSMLQREWGIGKTICVIDNNISIGEVCKMHLAPVGCEILYYPTSGEALSQMKVLAELGRKLDVVLVGYRLYGTNGEETAKLLRSDPDLQSIPIVFMCTAKQRKQVTLSNAHYLYKPLKKEQLLTVVHMLCTAQAHSSAPPSPDSVRDFNNSPDVRPPNSPLTSSSPSVYRNPLASSHRLFPHSLVTPLTLPTLPPLVEQDEKANQAHKENHFAEDIERVKQLQQEQNQLSQQLQKQQETDKMDSVQLQQPLPPPIKVADIPQQPSSNHIPSTPRDTTPTPTPRTPAANTTTPRNIASPRTALPDSPQARRNSLGHDQPLPAPAAPDAHALPPTETASPPPPPPKKETILLVEDNPINAKIASAVLRRHQFEVELAGNGQVALEKVKLGHGNFQLILMDIHMPVMDGLTCARLTRQYEKEHNLVQIPIIALTADATSLHRTACLEAGCNEFMSKPLDYPLLIEILKKLSAGGTLAAAQP